MAAAEPAFAAKAKAKAAAKPAPKPAEEPPPPPPPPPPEEPPPPAAEEAPPPPALEHVGNGTGGQLKTNSNKPAPYGSGYYSWGTRGGATLGQGSGARAQLNFGYPGTLGGSYAGAEGAFLFNLGEDLDVGIAARLPFFPFGLAPGGQVRYRVLKNGAFQLAIDGSVYLPMTFVSFFGPAFGFGLSLEPGCMGSYFIRDNMEIYFGVVLPVGISFYPAPVGFTFGFDVRGGFAYTLKKSNIGFYANLDFIPGFGNYAVVLASPLFVPTGIFGFFGFGFSAGAQFRL